MRAFVNSSARGWVIELEAETPEDKMQLEEEFAFCDPDAAYRAEMWAGEEDDLVVSVRRLEKVK